MLREAVDVKNEMQGKQQLGTNPTSEDLSKYNIKMLAELYRMLSTTATAAGPFAGVLQSLTKQIRAFLYSSDKSFDQAEQVRRGISAVLRFQAVSLCQ